MRPSESTGTFPAAAFAPVKRRSAKRRSICSMQPSCVPFSFITLNNTLKYNGIIGITADERVTRPFVSLTNAAPPTDDLRFGSTGKIHERTWQEFLHHAAP